MSQMMMMDLFLASVPAFLPFGCGSSVFPHRIRILVSRIQMVQVSFADKLLKYQPFTALIVYLRMSEIRPYIVQRYLSAENCPIQLQQHCLEQNQNQRIQATILSVQIAHSNVQRTLWKFKLGVIRQIFKVCGRFSMLVTRSNSNILCFLLNH